MNRSSMPKQVMTFANGGLASFIPRQTQIMGQPHKLAYINPREERMLYAAGGSGAPGPGGVPAFWELLKPSTWGDGQGYQGLGLSSGNDGVSEMEMEAYGGSQADYYNAGMKLPGSSAPDFPDDDDDDSGSVQQVATQPDSDAEPAVASVPRSLDFRFFGGYQPVSASDVLVPSSGADRPFVAPNDPRIAPMFAPGANIDQQLGIGSLMGSVPAPRSMYQGIMG